MEHNDVTERGVSGFRWLKRGKCDWKSRISRFLISQAGLDSLSKQTSGRCPAHGNGFY